MGAAAYNRGSALLSKLIDEGMPSNEARLFDDLTHYSARQSGVRVFSPTVIRFGPKDGDVSIMNRQAKGWAEYAYTYRSLWTLARHWRFAITGVGRDAFGRFLRVQPLSGLHTCPDCTRAEVVEG